MLETIFSLSSLLVLPFWLLMIALPHWRWTRRIVQSPLIAAGPAALYLILALPRLGALLPATRAESRVMGEASRTVRDEAMGLAEEVVGASASDDRPPARDWDNNRGPTVKGGETGVEAETMRSQPSDAEKDTQSSGDTPSEAGRATPYAEAAEAGERR